MRNIHYEGYKRLASELIIRTMKNYLGISMAHFPASIENRVISGEFLQSPECRSLCECLELDEAMNKFLKDVGLLKPF